MRALPAWALKVAAGLLTGLAAVGSTAYVAAHIKSASAPLHPAVANGRGGVLAQLGLGSASGSDLRPSGGHLVLKPSVESTMAVQPITITSVS